VETTCRMIKHHHDTETDMRAMRAEQFSGYGGLKLSHFPEPAVTNGKVLLRMTAVGVTPSSIRFSSANSPREGAAHPGQRRSGVVEQGGGTDFPAGSRVMFTGP